MARVVSEQELQTGGGLGSSNEPLFDFNFSSLGTHRTWKNVLNKQLFQAKLSQNRDPKSSENIGNEVTGALVRAIDRQLNSQSNLTPHSTLHFSMHATGFDHAFQSAKFTVDEFTNGGERLSGYMQSLANKLNSNQEFKPDQTFDVQVTFIRTPGSGGGNGNKYKPGRCAIEKLLNSKTSVIRINNTDELCCARAIETMRAWCHRNEDVDIVAIFTLP